MSRIIISNKCLGSIVLCFCFCVTRPSISQEALPADFPDIAKPALIQESLRALGRNGAVPLNDNSGSSNTLFLRHRILCETIAICEDVAIWAEDNNFQPDAIEIVLGHGSTEQYFIDITQSELADSNSIHNQALQVYGGVSAIAGARYFTWMAVIDRTAFGENQ